METSASEQIRKSTEIENRLKELLRVASQELRKSLAHYKKEEAHDRKLINTLQIPEYVFQLAEKYVNSDADIIKSEIPQTTSQDPMCISLLEKYLNSFNDIDNYLNLYRRTLKREIQKYEEMFRTRNSSQNIDGDTLFEPTLESYSVEPQEKWLADDETKEISTDDSNELIMARLLECFEIQKRIDEYSIEKEKLKNELGNMRHLPPNLEQAHKKLDELKVKYKEMSDKVSNLGSNLQSYNANITK